MQKSCKGVASNIGLHKILKLQSLQMIDVYEETCVNNSIYIFERGIYRGRCPRLKATKQNFSSSKPRKGSPLERYKTIMDKGNRQPTLIPCPQKAIRT